MYTHTMRIDSHTSTSRWAKSILGTLAVAALLVLASFMPLAHAFQHAQADGQVFEVACSHGCAHDSSGKARQRAHVALPTRTVDHEQVPKDPDRCTTCELLLIALTLGGHAPPVAGVYLVKLPTRTAYEYAGVEPGQRRGECVNARGPPWVA